VLLPEGIFHFPLYLDHEEQKVLLEAIRKIVQDAPLFVPAMPRTGKPMSVRMTNCGVLGWVTDKENGYRYQPHHPVTHASWPAIPPRLLKLWKELAQWPAEPEACLINFYDPSAKMGLHQDRDEQDLRAPVLSISLGDDCLFRVGQKTRDGKTVSVRLRSGDIIIRSGAGRLAFHAVDRIYPDKSPLLKNGGRINLTLRRVTPASPL
jgi:alkylated DNA repair protein (DNA oxidative demethylase)